MDYTLIVSRWPSKRKAHDALNLSLADFESPQHITDTIRDVFGPPEDYSLQIDDAADFPESLMEWTEGDGPNWAHVLDFYQVAKDLESSDGLDAFKVFFKANGTPGEAAACYADFQNRYRGEFDDTEAFGRDLAEGVGAVAQGYEQYFMYESFGRDSLMDYEVLEERYYFRK